MSDWFDGNLAKLREVATLLKDFEGQRLFSELERQEYHDHKDWGTEKAFCRALVAAQKVSWNYRP